MESKNVIPFRFIVKSMNSCIGGRTPTTLHATSAVCGIGDTAGKASVIASYSNSVLQFEKNADGTTTIH